MTAMEEAGDAAVGHPAEMATLLSPEAEGLELQDPDRHPEHDPLLGEQEQRCCRILPPQDSSVPIMSTSGMDVAEEASSEESDIVCRTIGDFGRWQLKLTFLLALLNIPCTCHISAPTFQGAPVDFWCARPPALRSLPVDVWKNISQPIITTKEGEKKYDACHIWDLNYTALGLLSPTEAIQALLPHNKIRECTRWEFDDSVFTSTTQQEWSLVCGKSRLQDVADMMFLTGVALGGLFSGMVSDKFGRRRTLVLSLIAQVMIGTTIAFNPWFEFFCVLRFLLGFISVGIVFSGFVLCMELVGGRWRTISGLCYLMPVSLSYIILTCVAYFLRDWRHLQLAISLPGALLLAVFWVVPESPRWLLTMGRKEQVAAILQKAARVNNLHIPAGLDKRLQQEVPEETGHSAGILDLFKTPNIRRNSLFLYVIWFSVYLAYYGLQLNISNLGGDLFVNTILSGVVELPAVAMSIAVLLKLGRRWPLSITLMVGGVAGLTTLLIPAGTTPWVTVACAMVGKFSVSSSNAVLPVFTAELFPTVVRNLGVGACNVPAGVALMLVPYLWLMASYGQAVPMAVLGSVSLIGGLTALLLPETAEMSLPQTIEEAEHKDRRRNGGGSRKNSTSAPCNGPPQSPAGQKDAA